MTNIESRVVFENNVFVHEERSSDDEDEMNQGYSRFGRITMRYDDGLVAPRCTR